jgi:hypothetical protein
LPATSSGQQLIVAARDAKRQGFRTHFLSRTPQEYDRHPVNPLDVADAAKRSFELRTPRVIVSDVKSRTALASRWLQVPLVALVPR